MKKVEDYIVVQEPKAKFRGAYVLILMVVSASSGAEAVRIARAKGVMDSYAPEYKKPQAWLFRRDRAYVF